jgi:ABC-type Na+ transport system ATPase subunit NatA
MRAVDVAADELAVEARGLVKAYGRVHVLDGVDLGVARGRVFALLGPNGAGKTTIPATATPRSLRPRPRPALADALIMSGRSLRMARRNIEVLLTSLLLPVMLMLLFVYLFGGPSTPAPAM